MKIVFMGTSDFAVPCLSSLAAHYEVVGVFTQPDRPKGRGMKMVPTPVKAEAQKLGIAVFQPEKVKGQDALDTLRALSPDCIVVVSYGQILPKVILDYPPLGCINVHASLLPHYRGAAPIHWAILNGERETGVTTMYMDVGLDTGDMILKSHCPITDVATVGELHDTLARQGAELIINTLRLVESGCAPRTAQALEEGDYAPMIGRELSLIDWSWDSTRICNRIRGLDPWPAAHTRYNDVRLKLFSPAVVDMNHGQQPGTVLSSGPKTLVVAAGTGAVEISEIQGDGSKRMSVSAYLLGRKIPEGTVLGG